MLKWSEFYSGGDFAYCLGKATKHCQKSNEDTLLFENKEYHMNGDMASESYCNIANHGYAGQKRIAFLLKDMKNFTVDGGGCEFCFDDVMLPFVIENCENITIKNLSLRSKKTFQLQGEVIESSREKCIVKLTDEQPYFVEDGKLYAGEKDGYNAVVFNLIEISEEHNFVDGGSDYIIDRGDKFAEFTEKSVGIIEVRGMNRSVKVGHAMVFMTRCRFSANIFINNSKNVTLKNVTVYSGLGMGVIAQKSENITIEGMKTCRIPGRYYSVNADATHFVNCGGLVWVKNCVFESQLDDALNVHGVYAKIMGKSEKSIIVKYMHHQTKGIDVFDENSEIRVLKEGCLAPYGNYVVKEVRRINSDYTELSISSNVDDIKVGDYIESLSMRPELLLENCRILDNRARGILIGAVKKAVVRNNYFHSHGISIFMEGNTSPWYEAGAVEDLLIENNTFDMCKYTRDGNAVIEMVPRKLTEEGKFYHSNIRIRKNRFKDCGGLLLLADNVDGISFCENVVEGCEKAVEYRNCTDICEKP